MLPAPTASMAAALAAAGAVAEVLEKENAGERGARMGHAGCRDSCILKLWVRYRCQSATQALLGASFSWCFLLPTDDNVAGPSKPAASAMPAKPAATPKTKAPAVPKAKPAAKPAPVAAPAEGGIKIKKPSNAYMTFVNSKRAEVKGESSKGCHAGCPAACL